MKYPTKLNLSMTKICFSLFATMCCSSVMAAPVENFGENLASLRNAFNQQKVHIVQFGDSHTAGDYLTEQLRKRLQSDVGVGGIGFAYPAKVSGQRNARHDYRSNGWTVNNSRFNRNGDYALGGITATADVDGASVTLTSQNYNNQYQDARILVQGDAGQQLKIKDNQGERQITLSRSGWQTLPSSMTLPVTVTANKGMSLGGFWLGANKGGTVSAIGINGATQDYWQRWRSGLSQDIAASQADMVILAYGTNEAFQAQVDSQLIAVQQAISQVRQALPNAAILVVNAPESLQSTSGSCGTRSPSLDTVQSQLRRLAQQNRTLYWSWQDAMGGACSMNNWVAKGLAAKDGVHFSRSGYEQLANDLYDNFKITLNSNSLMPSNSLPPSLGNPNRNTSSGPAPSASPNYTSPMNQGSGKICDDEGRCVSL
ncbi:MULTISPECIES: SGNH/GDSL hydrolase family protein [unclassified Acinetobacter]|uniref:SGNH/GDSL hydrolase family protein n=1 Tax=unclassified Acinetobacter TaxID=196816 RepID=UPI0035B7E1F1